MPKIQTEKYSRPASIAIVEAPPMRHLAFIDQIGFGMVAHFTASAEQFFEFNEKRSSAGDMTLSGGSQAAQQVTNQIITGQQPYTQGSMAGGVAAAGLIGALIDMRANETQRRAKGFHDLVVKAGNNMDLRNEFTAALIRGFEQKGITVLLVKDSVNAAPRLRWPAEGMDPKYYEGPTGLPTVNADLLLQYSPVAFYFAPGPLNSFRFKASVGVTLYNARTMEFLGYQVFEFSPSAFDSKAWKYEFDTYDELAKNVGIVPEALRQNLLALAPAIVDTVSKEASKR